ncbi:hypothetical protein EVAR_8954_1 [Eumeta japonica]|uniref:Uncharacterized protein n=1 Tax=Eumeta variegata TaxID=151549 RepID=A0A4C1U0F4_EUMVA|nr:hypothetical protein EVAR_8954_1 [Eumeta japonica]
MRYQYNDIYDRLCLRRGFPLAACRNELLAQHQLPERRRVRRCGLDRQTPSHLKQGALVTAMAKDGSRSENIAIGMAGPGSDLAVASEFDINISSNRTVIKIRIDRENSEY